MESREGLCEPIDVLIAEQVARRPDAVAVEFDNQRLTYRELTSRAGEVANELRVLGCGPGSVIGVATERSPEMVIAMLGVLKAGAAYLPLDPSYPPERLAFMLEDARATMILTQQHLKSRLPDHSVPVRFVSTAPCPAEGRTQASTAPRSVRHIAYIIYTSGSTGTPKGVAVQHRSLVNLLWDCGFARLDEDETVLQFTSSSFDVSAFEIWGALVNGCRLVVAPPGPLSMEELTSYIESHGVTTLWLTAGLLTQLDETTLPRLHRLRQFIAGGDVVSPTVCAEILRTFPEVKLINGYGPTETTVFAATQPITETTLEPSVPIGSPVRNTTAYILDARLRPAEEGEAGELYIGGEAVAIGYMGRPSLTAQRFVADPFSRRPGSRMYRTGDLARFLPDGTMQFIGRLDDQLKVRGYRIEPQEIVSALQKHPGVRSAFVAAHGEGAEGKQLVAYVLSENSTPSTRTAMAAQLRDYLHGILPDYMVPTLFMVMEKFPVNANGKLDRAALPTSRASWHEPGNTDGRGELTDIEKALTEAWMDIMGPDAGPISIEVDLFSVGGDSLRMTSLVSKIRRLLGIELPLREVFEYRTLAALASRIEHVHGENRAIETITASPHRDKVPLTHAQQRMWFLDQLQPGTAAYNVPLLIRLTGTLNEAVMVQCIRDLIRRHESLRTVFAGSGEEPYQMVLDTVTVDVPVIDMRSAPEKGRDDAVRQRVHSLVSEPFDLATGPLVRACLLRVSDSEYVFLIVAHHIVTDGWSMDVMLRDLSALYDAHAHDGHEPLIPLPVQYPDFSLWQRSYLRADALQASVAYWRAQLADAPRRLELPTDRRRPSVQTLNGSSVWVSLDRFMAARLRSLSLNSGHTLSMTLIAALAIILQRQSGQDEVVIGSLVANRTQPESENLIGLFINTLALRFNLQGDPMLSDLLEHVRSVCLDAYTHQDVPFERLVDELRLERDLSRTPLFQVLFNHIATRVDNVETGDIRWHREHAEEASAKYDLSLYVWEGADDIQCQFIYNTDLFDGARINHLAEQYLAVLAALAVHPGHHLSELSLATPLAGGIVPDPAATFTRPNVPDLVSRVLAVCAEHPHRTAMVDGERVWSYADLADRIRMSAATLRARGVRPGDMVPVIARRTAWLAVSVLAILYTGAAAVFLDPVAPTDWLRERLTEIEPTTVVAVGAIPDALAGRQSISVVQLADLDGHEDIAAASEDDYEADLTVPAFVLYTSGTTGRPKGVVSSQLPLCRFLEWQTGHFELTGDDRFCVLSGLAHDPILRDMFAALWVGGQVHWPAETIRQEPARLAEWMNQHTVTAAHVTPTLLEMILTGNETTAPSLRYLFLGGEALTRRHVREAAAWAPNAACVNFYGTTETPQAAGYFVVPELGGLEPEQAPPGIPVGSGSTEAQLLVLSPGGHLAGIGELGEIAVRSPYLALGYLSSYHAVDGSDFRQDPQSPDTDATMRIYHTGDLGRYRPDGAVEYVGRKDRQINLRGYRIAPQEIEAALKTNPDVWEAAAFVQESPNNNSPLLTACVVPRPGTVPIPSELRDYLATILPAHLVPQHVMLTDMLPMTSNGKIDIEALRTDLPSHPEPQEQLEIRGEIETAMAALWQDILGEAPANEDQSFFDSGNSLLGALYMSRIRKRFGVDVPLRELFSNPSIRMLANAVRNHK